jgi:hypothetical protein
LRNSKSRINSYHQYEAGEMPSVANAKLIQMVEDPKKFIDMVEFSRKAGQVMGR